MKSSAKDDKQPKTCDTDEFENNIAKRSVYVSVYQQNYILVLLKTKMSCFLKQGDKQLFTNNAFASGLVTKVITVLIFKTNKN